MSKTCNQWMHIATIIYLIFIHVSQQTMLASTPSTVLIYQESTRIKSGRRAEHSYKEDYNV